MNSRKLLLGLASITIVGLLAGLVLLLRPSSPRTEKGSSSDPPRVASSVPSPSPSSPPVATPSVASAPAARPVPIAPPPGPLGAEAAAGNDEPVRDHRGERPTTPPSVLLPLSTATVRQALGPAVRACATALPEQPATPVRVTVSATFRAEAGRIRSRGLAIGGAETLGATYISCMTEAFAKLDTDAPHDQADGEDLVHMLFTVP